MSNTELINYGHSDRRVVNRGISVENRVVGVDGSRNLWIELRTQPKMAFLPEDVVNEAAFLEHGYDWYKRIKPEGLIDGSMLEDLDESKHDLIWIKTYEGLLPNMWKNRHQIMKDLEAAGEQGFQFPAGWVTAVAVHCDNNVLEALARYQNLRPHQLGLLLANPHFIAGYEGIFREQLIQIQRDKGMSDRDVENALTVAQELIKKRKLRTRTAKLDRPMNKLGD